MPDINLLLALATRRHAHHEPAARWFDGLVDGQAAFCRITQMGFLRLLTNARVMGPDPVDQRTAWKTYRTLSSDARMQFLPEPEGMEPVWKQIVSQGQPATNVWTDAYLQAFAYARELTVATFDRGLQRFAGPKALILG